MDFPAGYRCNSHRDRRRRDDFKTNLSRNEHGCLFR
jgi:hypothetical protein